MSNVCEVNRAMCGNVTCNPDEVCVIVVSCPGHVDGPCETCPITRCLPSPPYCSTSDECPVGPCLGHGVCSCDVDADCLEGAGGGGGTGDSKFLCRGGVCAPSRCESRLDCCNRDNVCTACSVDGVCLPPIETGVDPVLACGLLGGVGVTAGTLAGVAVAGALALAAARRRRRRQKEAAAESWGTQSRNAP